MDGQARGDPRACPKRLAAEVLPHLAARGVEVSVTGLCRCQVHTIRAVAAQVRSLEDRAPVGPSVTRFTVIQPTPVYRWRYRRWPSSESPCAPWRRTWSCRSARRRSSGEPRRSRSGWWRPSTSPCTSSASTASRSSRKCRRFRSSPSPPAGCDDEPTVRDEITTDSPRHRRRSSRRSCVDPPYVTTAVPAARVTSGGGPGDGRRALHRGMKRVVVARTSRRP